MNRSYSPAARGIKKIPRSAGSRASSKERFRQDLLDGHLFLFVNRRRDRIKALYFDHGSLAISVQEAR